MFKILAGDYGNPPDRVDFNHFLGIATLSIRPKDFDNLNGFNNKVNDVNSWTGGFVDTINKAEDVTKIEIVNEQNIDRYSAMNVLNTVLGAAEYGPAGALLGNVGKSKKDILFYVETRVGNCFLAKASEKNFKIFNDNFGVTEEQQAEEAFNKIKSTEGNNNEANEDSKVDLVKDLEKLGDLKEKGLLSDDEFAKAKAKLLS